MKTTSIVALAATLALSVAALADPRITVTTIGADLSADGTAVCGWLYNKPTAQYQLYTWKQGVGFAQIPAQAPSGGSTLSISGNGSALTSQMNNTSNWGGLNCFGGYSEGVAQPNLLNCVMGSIVHRYTASTGWVNGGSIARYPDPATGRMVGATICGDSINAPQDISANGRYIVGGAWSATALNSIGEPSSGYCGDYKAFRWDSQTGQFLQLASTSSTTRADRVNADGTVISGYQYGEIPDGQGGFYTDRVLTVWVNNVPTVLDPYGSQDNAPLSDAGGELAAAGSPAFVLERFGLTAPTLVKWRRTGSNWTATALGHPADRVQPDGQVLSCVGLSATGISNNGNTIVGMAVYPNPIEFEPPISRAFIWRPSINNGVPMDLMDYLATIDPSGTTLTPGLLISACYGISSDGNNILISCVDARSECTAPASTLQTYFSGILTLSPGGDAPQAPSVVMGPADEATRCTWNGWGAVFNVFAGGTWPLNYQWQREDPAHPGQWINLTNNCSGENGSAFPWDTTWDYEGTNQPQLRVNVFAADNTHDGLYRVVVSNAWGSVTSAPAALTFLPPINPSQPVSTVGCSAEPAVFTVGDVPGGVEYYWQVCYDVENDLWWNLDEGSNDVFGLGGVFTATGAHSSTVRINPGTLPAASTYLFRCAIADSCNYIPTNPATLTVLTPCGMADVAAQGGVPASCGDGVLDNNDFIVFIDYFFESNDRADVGMQGGVPGSDNQFDNNDFIVFIDYFFNGCN